MIYIIKTNLNNWNNFFPNNYDFISPDQPWPKSQ